MFSNLPKSLLRLAEFQVSQRAGGQKRKANVQAKPAQKPDAVETTQVQAGKMNGKGKGQSPSANGRSNKEDKEAAKPAADLSKVEGPKPSEEPNLPSPGAKICGPEACSQDTQEAAAAGTKWPEDWADYDRGWGYWYGKNDWNDAWGKDWNNSWGNNGKDLQWPQQEFRSGPSAESLASQHMPGAPETPASYLRKRSSLDSEMLLAFQRLDTIDRTASPSLEKLPSNLVDKFDLVATPDKANADAKATPSTSPGTSPNGASSGDGPDSSCPSPGNKAPETKKPNEAEPEETNASTEKPAATKTADDAAETPDKRMEELNKKKKAAHARYMRYWRSVHGSLLSKQHVAMMLLPCT